MSGTKSEGFLKDTLEMTAVREQIAEGGRRYAAISETLYFLQLRCEGVSTLDQALQRYCTGSIMTNKKWTDSHDQLLGHFDTNMRASLRNLPPHLFISLSRYKTEWSTGEPVVNKINSLLEFPERINFFKYTMQGRPDAVIGRGEEHRVQTEEEAESLDPSKIADTCNEFADPLGPEEYEYELVGMIIHTGGANSGHYFSYIQERGPEGGTGRWMEFNDAYVSTWDPRRMKEDCFGGDEEYEGMGYWTTVSEGGKFVRKYVEGKKYTRTRYQNAFIVVYDKVPAERYMREQKMKRENSAGACSDDAKSSAKVELEAEADAEAGGASTEIGGLSPVQAFAGRVRAQQATKSSSLQLSRAVVPADLIGSIASDNRSFWRKRNVLNTEYFDFMKGLIGAAMREGQGADAGAGPAAGAEAESSIVPYPAAGIKDS